MLLFLITLNMMSLDSNLDYTVIRNFELPDDPDYFMSVPYAVAVAPQGRLFVLDTVNSKVHVWDEEGRFVKSFGETGDGPGEFVRAATIEANEDYVFVYARRKISRFDHDGNFIDRHRGISMQNFVALSNDLFLTANKKFNGPRDIRGAFELTDGKGQSVNVLKEFKNEAYLRPREGDDMTLAKAYGPEVCVQKGDNGKWYFGFSQNTTIFEVDETGTITNERSYLIPTSKPTPEEVERYKNLEWPNIQGGRTILKDIKTLKFSYEHPKAYYTHFLVKGDKIAFVSTPMSGIGNYGNGYYWGQYYINDFNTGKVLTRGRYEFPEDSMVFYKNGRIIGLILNQDDQYEVKELTLKGL
jgi:hypothetical protein